MKNGWRAVICVCAALGWWGFLYPQLFLLPDTYRIVCEDGTVQDAEEVVEWDFDDTVYEQILNAGPEGIRFRSKLLEEIEKFLEKQQEEERHVSGRVERGQEESAYRRV